MTALSEKPGKPQGFSCLTFRAVTQISEGRGLFVCFCVLSGQRSGAHTRDSPWGSRGKHERELLTLQPHCHICSPHPTTTSPCPVPPITPARPASLLLLHPLVYPTATPPHPVPPPRPLAPSPCHVRSPHPTATPPHPFPPATSPHQVCSPRLTAASPYLPHCHAPPCLVPPSRPLTLFPGGPDSPEQEETSADPRDAG